MEGVKSFGEGYTFLQLYCIFLTSCAKVLEKGYRAVVKISNLDVSYQNDCLLYLQFFYDSMNPELIDKIKNYPLQILAINFRMLTLT
jgi:hypothetical protein